MLPEQLRVVVEDLLKFWCFECLLGVHDQFRRNLYNHLSFRNVLGRQNTQELIISLAESDGILDFWVFNTGLIAEFVVLLPVFLLFWIRAFF